MKELNINDKYRCLDNGKFVYKTTWSIDGNYREMARSRGKVGIGSMIGTPHGEREVPINKAMTSRVVGKGTRWTTLDRPM